MTTVDERGRASIMYVRARHAWFIVSKLCSICRNKNIKRSMQFIVNSKRYSYITQTRVITAVKLPIDNGNLVAYQMPLAVSKCWKSSSGANAITRIISKAECFASLSTKLIWKVTTPPVHSHKTDS